MKAKVNVCPISVCYMSRILWWPSVNISKWKNKTKQNTELCLSIMKYYHENIYL